MYIAPFVNRPFGPFSLPLVIRPHHALDVPQYLFRKLDRRQSKFQNFFVGVVLRNAGKCFFHIFFVHFEAAARQYTINRALRHEVLESLVPFASGIAGPFLIFLIFLIEPLHDSGYLRFHIGIVEAEGASERLPDVSGVFGRHLPDVRRIRFGTGLLSIANIENVLEGRLFRVRPVDERHTFRAALHPAPHPLIPEVDSGAGGRARPLGVNEHLVHERVFIHLPRATEERRPAFGVLRDIDYVRGENVRRFLYFLADYRVFVK
jgi:hypothetical protein